MDRAEFIGQIEHTGGFGPGQAEAAIDATLEALGAALLPNERASLAADLPADLRPLLLRVKQPSRVPDLERFYERVQRHEHVRSGRAREHAQLVCGALQQLLPAESLQLVTHHLPWLEPLLSAPEPAEPPSGPEILRRREAADTLARGRPGSHSPIASARPDRAHSQSIAKVDEPHRDTKLSSSQGMTQEREQETLANGKPGSRRPLSG